MTESELLQTKTGFGEALKREIICRSQLVIGVTGRGAILELARTVWRSWRSSPCMVRSSFSVFVKGNLVFCIPQMLHPLRASALLREVPQRSRRVWSDEVARLPRGAGADPQLLRRRRGRGCACDRCRIRSFQLTMLPEFTRFDKLALIHPSALISC